MQRLMETCPPIPSARYKTTWGTEFWQFVHQGLFAEATILDVGSGRSPTIAPANRPPGAHYVGLDASAKELAAAPFGSYDETVVGDAGVEISELKERFDLIISWNAFEHIRRLDLAARAFYRYAKPGGRLVACLAGRYAVFALANRLLPTAIGARLVAKLRGRPLESVFRAHYDHCTYHGLRRAFADWEDLTIIPLWHAADYFGRLPRVQRVYLHYEDFVARQRLTVLSTHYVIVARKSAGR